MMVAIGSAPRMLLCGLTLGACAFAASPAGAAAMLSSAPIVAAGIALQERDRRPFEPLLRFVRDERFCDWHSEHRLCAQVNTLSLSCDQETDDPLCAESAPDRFCIERPDHPLCGDVRFCAKRPQHPLCKDQPPSPS